MTRGPSLEQRRTVALERIADALEAIAEGGAVTAKRAGMITTVAPRMPMLEERPSVVQGQAAETDEVEPMNDES